MQHTFAGPIMPESGTWPPTWSLNVSQTGFSDWTLVPESEVSMASASPGMGSAANSTDTAHVNMDTHTDMKIVTYTDDSIPPPQLCSFSDWALGVWLGIPCSNRILRYRSSMTYSCLEHFCAHFTRRILWQFSRHPNAAWRIFEPTSANDNLRLVDNRCANCSIPFLPGETIRKTTSYSARVSLGWHDGCWSNYQLMSNLWSGDVRESYTFNILTGLPARWLDPKVSLHRQFNRLQNCDCDCSRLPFCHPIL